MLPKMDIFIGAVAFAAGMGIGIVGSTTDNAPLSLIGFLGGGLYGGGSLGLGLGTRKKVSACQKALRDFDARMQLQPQPQPGEAAPGYVAPGTPAPAEPAPGPAPQGCGSDSDCKGDRICVDHACVNP